MTIGGKFSIGFRSVNLTAVVIYLAVQSSFYFWQEISGCDGDHWGLAMIGDRHWPSCCAHVALPRSFRCQCDTNRGP
jgi:hypothetical protein